MADIGDLRSWAPGGLEAVSSLLANRATDLRGLSDDLVATIQPAEWVGAAADAAYARRGEITEGLRRLLAQVQAVSATADEAGVSLRSVQEALRETDELAGRSWYQVGDDGVIRDIAPPDLNLNEHDAGDRERMGHELADRVGEVVRNAQDLDTRLSDVMNAAVDNTIDDGTGTTLVGAASAGLAFGTDTTTLPPPDGGTPAANNAYWDSLSDADRQDVLDHHPEWVGNLDGIPAVARDEANRTLLPGDLERVTRERDEAQAARDRLDSGTSTDPGADGKLADNLDVSQERVKSLEAITSLPANSEDQQLLVLDTSGELVKAAVAVGDVDTADHVSVHIPGMTTTVGDSLDGKVGEANALTLQTEDQLRRQGRGDETVASVVWIGYEAPQNGEVLDDFDLTDTAATEDTAKAAAPVLSNFLNGIDASRTSDPDLTTLAHSYGSTTTGLGLMYGDGTGVDNAIFYGSPGLGTDDITDLGIQDGHVFVEEAKNDPVADLATFGSTPTSSTGLPGCPPTPAPAPTGSTATGPRATPSTTRTTPWPSTTRPSWSAGCRSGPCTTTGSASATSCTGGPASCDERTTMKRPRSAALAVLTVLCSACSTTTTTGGTDVDPLTELHSRPSFEDTVATYTAMEVEIRAAVTAAVPTVTWKLEREGRTSGCAEPFDNLGGKFTGLDSYGAPGAIPDDAWPTAVAAAETVARTYGFDDTATVVDAPSDHQVRFRSSTDGAYVDFGTGVNVILATFTGCNLPTTTATPSSTTTG